MDEAAGRKNRDREHRRALAADEGFQGRVANIDQGIHAAS
jgi:hypothetical protein